MMHMTVAVVPFVILLAILYVSSGQQCLSTLDPSVQMRKNSKEYDARRPVIRTYSDWVQQQSLLWDGIDADPNSPYKLKKPKHDTEDNMCKLFCSESSGCGFTVTFSNVSDAQLEYVRDSPFRDTDPSPYGVAAGGDTTVIPEGTFYYPVDITPSCPYEQIRLKRGAFKPGRELLLVQAIKKLDKGDGSGNSFVNANCFVSIEPSISVKGIREQFGDDAQNELLSFSRYRNRIHHSCIWDNGHYQCKNLKNIAFDDWKALDKKYQKTKVKGFGYQTRATDLFPSGDRLCIWTEQGQRKIRIEHIYNTDIGGFLQSLSGLFSPTDVYANECRSLTEAIEKLN